MQKVEVITTCDIPHKKKPAEDVATVSFAVDGRAFEIDLCSQHREDLRDKLGLFEQHARRARTRRPTRRHRLRSRDIREWARRNGYEISDRGRIPAEVQARYAAAH